MISHELTILQDQESWLRAKQFQGHAEIEQMRLAASSLKASPPESLESYDGEFKIEVGHRPGAVRREDRSAAFSVDFLFRIVPDNDEAEFELIKLECSIEVTYALADQYKPEAEELEAFHQASVIFNCWPYFREYVQNTTVRCCLPPAVVPFLYIGLKVEQEDIQEAHGPKQSKSTSRVAKRTTSKKR